MNYIYFFFLFLSRVSFRNKNFWAREFVCVLFCVCVYRFVAILCVIISVQISLASEWLCVCVSVFLCTITYTIISVFSVEMLSLRLGMPMDGENNFCTISTSSPVIDFLNVMLASRGALGVCAWKERWWCWSIRTHNIKWIKRDRARAWASASARAHTARLYANWFRKKTDSSQERSLSFRSFRCVFFCECERERERAHTTSIGRWCLSFPCGFALDVISLKIINC